MSLSLTNKNCVKLSITTLNPRHMDTETLEAFAAEGWAEFVLVRGVCTYGCFLFLALVLNTFVVADVVSGRLLSWDLGIAVFAGFVFGSYFRRAVTKELHRRNHTA